MFFKILALLSVAGLSYGSTIANQYIDSVLNTALRNEIRSLNLDPVELTEFETHFEEKYRIIGIVTGEAKYSKGHLTGLSEARRYSECQGPYFSFGEKIINCTITFNSLQATYDGRLRFGKLPTASIQGKGDVKNIQIFIEVASKVEYVGQQIYLASLKNFLFKQIGSINVTFTGLGPFNKYITFLENGFKTHVEGEVFNHVSQTFQYALGKAVLSVPMPS